jgi:hypothetical protein
VNGRHGGGQHRLHRLRLGPGGGDCPGYYAAASVLAWASSGVVAASQRSISLRK